MNRLLAILLLLSWPALAAEIKVAVATNFNGTLQKLAQVYQAEHGHKLLISSGASGALHTQIVNGAPFDVFLSADTQRPSRLISEGYAVSDSSFTYAFGLPVLWSARPGFIDDQGAILAQGSFRFLALAEPRNAPYGAAAQQILSSLGLWDELNANGKIVGGGSVGKTHSQIAIGAAELGFVALSQVNTEQGIAGSYWLPPADLYEPIAQAAVLLTSAQHNEAAQHFLHWLRTSSEAERIIVAAGYRINAE